MAVRQLEKDMTHYQKKNTYLQQKRTFMLIKEKRWQDFIACLKF